MYAVKNKYYKHSKLDEQCFRYILQLFAMDLTAVQCAKLTGVNVRSVNSIYLKLRDRIAEWCERQAQGTPGLNIDPHRFQQADGMGASYLQSEADGIIGLRLYLHEEQVYCAHLMSANDADIKRVAGSAWNDYPIGIDLRRDMALKLKSTTHQRASIAGDVDRIDAFGRYLRLRLGKFKGLRRGKFFYHLKESEYRYNHRRHELYTLLLGMLGEAPIE